MLCQLNAEGKTASFHFLISKFGWFYCCIFQTSAPASVPNNNRLCPKNVFSLSSWGHKWVLCLSRIDPEKTKTGLSCTFFFFVKSSLFCSYVHTQDDACFANDTLLANNSNCCDHQASTNTSLKSSRKWNSLFPCLESITSPYVPIWHISVLKPIIAYRHIWYFVQKKTLEAF